MTDHHVRKPLTWRPPAPINEFIRAEATRKGLRLSEYLLTFVEREKERMGR